MKAIHNDQKQFLRMPIVVFYASKIRKWKPFTTEGTLNVNLCLLFSMRQRYENESHSQRKRGKWTIFHCCFLCVKDTKMKAIHNASISLPLTGLLFSMRQRYENESHSQRPTLRRLLSQGCFLCVKDTKMKAIHNFNASNLLSLIVVFYASKIRKWKPFTTRGRSDLFLYCCFLCVKDTKMKAIHNERKSTSQGTTVVFYASKIRKWKPFTTMRLSKSHAYKLFSMRQRYENESHSQPGCCLAVLGFCCFLCVKDTKMKAIHN